jgi:hypothetical protein
MHRVYRYPDRWEPHVAACEDTGPERAASLVDGWRRAGLDDRAMYLVLALASARWVDHRGPLVGHGTFNGSPLLQAGDLLPEPLRELALLQMTAYVLDLIQHPNYGPYVMLEMTPVEDDGHGDAWTRFAETVESGFETFLAEHRLVALVRRFGREIRWPLTRLALRQYPDNEHRLLIVQRAAELLEQVGWDCAEPLMRSAVQYLASRPEVSWADQVQARFADLIKRPPGGQADGAAAWRLATRLVEVEAGGETAELADAVAAGLSVDTVGEAIALAGSAMMLASGFDAHAVTGIHVVLDLLRDPAAPSDIAGLAWLLALSSQRTRRQKAIRDQWREDPPVRDPGSALTSALADAWSDPTGMEAAGIARGYLAMGGDPRLLTVALMEMAMETASPFEAIHNVKMLWGLYRETERSRSAERWRHLAAGARSVARVAADPTETADPVLAQWRHRPQFVKS